MLDLFTIQETQGRLDNLHVAMVGDLKMAAPFTPDQALAKFDGNRFTSSRRTRWQCRNTFWICSMKKGSHGVCTALFEAMAEVDILYMTRVQKSVWTRPSTRTLKRSLFFAPAISTTPKPILKVLHPLPRVDEIATDVDKTPHAWYFQQAGNGIFARQALLALVLNRDLVL
ncbi:hypothetical protein ACLK1U_23985 [Escherichia coli]